MTFLQGVRYGNGFLENDWRYMTYPQFLLLKSLCQLSQKTVKDSIDVFSKTKLLTPQVNKKSEFEAQCGVIVSEFYNSIQNAFGRSLDLSTVLKQGDFLVSGLNTNFVYFGYYNPQENVIYVSPSPLDFTDENGIYCSCYKQAKCTQAVYTYASDGRSRMLIPGWRSGCYIQDALLSSTFECYFNASCLDHLRQMYDVPLNVQRLVSRNTSQFPPTATVDSIVRQLLVDELLSVSNFTAYYLACAPPTCSYTVNEKRAVVVIIGTLVGIWGGLTKALDLIVPRSVHFVRTKGHQWFRVLISALRPNRIRAFR
jgi:hypothetical protein